MANIFLQQISKHRTYFIFSIGAILIFLIQITIAIVLTEIFHIWHMYSYAIALVCDILLLYIYHSFITFKGWNRMPNNFARFLLLYIFSYTLSWLLVFAITHLGIYYIPSIIFVSMIMSILNYNINKRWVFSYNYATN